LFFALVGFHLLLCTAQSIDYSGDQLRGRIVEFDEVTAHSVLVRAKWTSFHEDRLFLWNFTTDGFPRWRARFFKLQTDEISAFTYRVGFFRIVEFNMTDLTNGLPRASVVQSLSLLAQDSSWTNIAEYSQQVNGVPYVFFNTSLTKNGVTVTLSHYLPSNLVVLDKNSTLVPNALKMNIQIDNWAFQSPTSRLALVFGFCARDFRASGINGNPISSTDEGSVGIGSDPQDAFMWARRIWTRVGGGALNTERIIITRLFSETLFLDWAVASQNETVYGGDREFGETQDVALLVLNTTDQPTHVIWDPYIGMSPANRLTVPFVTLLLLAMAFLLYS